MSKNLLRCLSMPLLVLLFLSMTPHPQLKNARLRIIFRNTANGRSIQPDSSYKNAFGEDYSVSKLKYYISNIVVGNYREAGSVHLINAFTDSSLLLTVPEGSYSSLHFLIGVDSLLNCSGAQSGALDPLNDMFWTWNSGYVMFKLEGTSPASLADLNRLEFHVGGYKGFYKTQREIKLAIPEIKISAAGGHEHELIIEMNLDKFWNGTKEIHISNKPVLTTPGEFAKTAADNISGMFYLAGTTVHELTKMQ